MLIKKFFSIFENMFIAQITSKYKYFFLFKKSNFFLGN